MLQLLEILLLMLAHLVRPREGLTRVREHLKGLVR